MQDFGIKEGLANVGENADEILTVDRIHFKDTLDNLMEYYEEINAFSFFQLAQLAYEEVINPGKIKELNFYHIHNPSPHAQLNLIRMAPHIKWVMMVRDPVQSCESWVSKIPNKNDYRVITSRISRIFFDIDRTIYQDKNAIAVRLEDLKNNPHKTIPELCNWLGIEETDSLYQMTAQGKKWWGDPSSPDYKKDGMDPFGKTSISRSVGKIFSETDQFVLNTLFYPFRLKLGYAEENQQQFENDLKAIRPLLDELFDFEKEIINQTNTNPEEFQKSGSYLYLRSSLIERWNTLNEQHTYPDMINPLFIEN
jgi:hypothetical protein